MYDNRCVEPRTLVRTVNCLSCGETYGKPEGRGTVQTNPGCPECGYLGWEPAGSAPAASSASAAPLLRGSAPPPALLTRLTPPK